MTTPNANAQLSAAGEHEIERREGVVLHAYRDQSPKIVNGKRGYPTIGIGHKMRDGDGYDESSVITLERARWQLHQDCEPDLAVIRAKTTVPLTQHQIDSLVCIGINIGAGDIHGPDNGLDDSTLLKVINCQAGSPGEGLTPQTPEWFAAVRFQFMRWTRSAGVILPELVKRRAIEATLFETPDVPADLSNEEKAATMASVIESIDANMDEVFANHLATHDTDPAELAPTFDPTETPTTKTDLPT